jgi:hypothetical protein
MHRIDKWLHGFKPVDCLLRSPKVNCRADNCLFRSREPAPDVIGPAGEFFPLAFRCIANTLKPINRPAPPGEYGHDGAIYS